MYAWGGTAENMNDAQQFESYQNSGANINNSNSKKMQAILNVDQSIASNSRQYDET